MGNERYRAGSGGGRFGGAMNNLAREHSSASVSAYTGTEQKPDVSAMDVQKYREKLAGNEDPIARAVRIAKEKKALAEAKAKAKAEAEAAAQSE